VSTDRIRKALDRAGTTYRQSGDKFHVPAMGFGWHTADAVAAWLARR
jgi:hypothetical protein